MSRSNFATMQKCILLALPIICLLFPATASADNFTLLAHDLVDPITHRYLAQVVIWKTAFHKAGLYLFWSLALLSLVWQTSQQLLKGDGNLNSLLGHYVRYLIFIGFFYFLLENAVSGYNIAGTIFESLRSLAGQASGTSHVGLSPAGVLNSGLHLLLIAIQEVTWSNLVDSALILIVTIIVVVIMALIALDMLLAIINLYILMYAGTFFLGFGSSNWTSDIAINYFRSVFQQSVRYMAMVLIVGIGQSFLANMVGHIHTDFDLTDAVALLVTSLILYMISNKVPDMLAGMISGGGAMGGGSAASQLAGAAATIATAAAGMQMAGKMMKQSTAALGKAGFNAAAQVGGARDAYKTAGQLANPKNEKTEDPHKPANDNATPSGNAANDTGNPSGNAPKGSENGPPDSSFYEPQFPQPETNSPVSEKTEEKVEGKAKESPTTSSIKGKEQAIKAPSPPPKTRMGHVKSGMKHALGHTQRNLTAKWKKAKRKTAGGRLSQYMKYAAQAEKQALEKAAKEEAEKRKKTLGIKKTDKPK